MANDRSADPPRPLASGGPTGRERRLPQAAPRVGGPDELTEEELAEQVAAMRAELANSPVEVVVANHCYGLFELAAVYLSQQPPLLRQARLAIDALGSLVDGLEGRLGEAEEPLKDGLSQLRAGLRADRRGPAGRRRGRLGRRRQRRFERRFERRLERRHRGFDGAAVARHPGQWIPDPSAAAPTDGDG